MQFNSFDYVNVFHCSGFYYINIYSSQHPEFQNIVITLIKNCILQLSSPSPGLIQPPDYIFSLRDFPVLDFHISLIIQYMIFCDWFLSRSIMFQGFSMWLHGSVHHVFSWPNNISLCGYTTFLKTHSSIMNICVVSSFSIL